MADLRDMVMTTSGRAALFQALLQLNLPTGSIVLCPTYHCPTMIAPAILAGLKVDFYPLGQDGLPNLVGIPVDVLEKTGAIIVAHYFGMPKSLVNVRTWCDQNHIALIEDCAHCLFGYAGQQSIGTWGDYATASLSKFLPVPEAGILASGRHSINRVKLDKKNLKAQIKGIIDVIEFSATHRGFWPISIPMDALFHLKNSTKANRPLDKRNSTPTPVEDMMHQCDMGRIKEAPLWISQFLGTAIPWRNNIIQRRQNFQDYLREFDGILGVQPLFPSLPEDAVPYVFPLWVDNCDILYEHTKACRLPVFRWDRLWPGTPQDNTDHGYLWGKHVLQLLCHQSLSSIDIRMISREIKNLLQNGANPNTGTTQ